MDTVKYEFGIKQKVTAKLYKLLVYEKGSFFMPHRDTKKAHRMFATLVICLPSRHEGGQLIVSHAGESQEMDFSGKTSSYELQYAAFYADCQELAKFLKDKDKDTQVHRLSRRKDLRRHLHRQIDHHRIDCAHVTERRGRPFTLVCTKNQASYERELQQYQTDCKLLKELSNR